MPENESLKRPRLYWLRIGDPSNTQRSFSENMKLSGKRASSTWVCSWIEGLASANTCRSRLPRPCNVEKLVASVVNSKLPYAAPVWTSALNNHAIQKKLFSAQRGVVLRIVSAFLTVSTSSSRLLLDASAYGPWLLLCEPEPLQEKRR